MTNSEDPSGKIQPCLVRRWYLERIMPSDPSFGDGITYGSCIRCGRTLPVDTFAGRRLQAVMDGWGCRCSIDLYCTACSGYLHEYNSEIGVSKQ